MIFLKAYTRINLGDDLFIKKICDEYANQKFFILADRKYKKNFKDIKNLKVMSYSYNRLSKKKNNLVKYKKEYNRVLKKISKKCDTYIYIGGSIFIEKGKTSIERVKDLKEEIGCFKRSYIIGANFGPYNTNEYITYVHDELIPSIDYISFRDINSYNLFKDLDNVIYAPDILFSIDLNRRRQKRKEMGISLIHHLDRKELKENYDEYLNQLINLSIKYIDQGYIVRLLSFCSYENDPVAIDDFLKRIPVKYKDNIIVNYYDGNIDDFLEKVSGLDTIIATRFHSIVLGLKYYHKVIPICYSNKSMNLLNDLDIIDYVTFKNIKKMSQINPSKLNFSKLKKIEKCSKKHFELLDINKKIL